MEHETQQFLESHGIHNTGNFIIGGKTIEQIVIEAIQFGKQEGIRMAVEKLKEEYIKIGMPVEAGNFPIAVLTSLIKKGK